MTENIENPNVKYLQGMMECYVYNIRNVKLNGPTKFGHLISDSMKLAAYNKKIALE